jgi:vesicle coat complex subunit
VPRLIPFLTDSLKELRFAAAEALGEARAFVAVAPLTGILQDPDRNLRRAAAESLGHIRDPQAVPALLLVLDDPHWSVRCAAAAALGRIRSPKATSGLVARLDDADATVRRAAITALGEIGDARAARHLIEHLEDPGLQSSALDALRGMGAMALAEIERALVLVSAEVRRLLVNLIGKLDDRRAVKVLLASLSDPIPAVRAEAALVLGDVGHLEAVRPLTQLKAVDPSVEVRQAAAVALRKLGPRNKT